MEGTWRPHRHGERPAGATVLALPVSRADWRPEEADTADLGPRARDWLQATLAEYQLSDIEGQRLLQALRSLTRVEEIERAIEDVTDGEDGAAHPLHVALVREIRLFESLWAALRLERA